MSAPNELARSLRGQPTADWKDLGLRIELGYRLRMGGPGCFAASVSQRRMTKSDREGRPVHVLALVGDTPAEVLRNVADLLDPNGPEIAP